MTADTHAPAPEHHDDVVAPAVQGGGTEHVDQLVVELLLGVR